MTRKMRQVTADFQKWEDEGASIEGSFQGTEEVTTEIGPMKVGLLLQEDGVPIRFVMGEGLQRDFAEIIPPMFVNITFKGKIQTSGGKSFNRFTVLVEDVKPPEAEAS